MATIFTQIINNEIPSFKIAENQHFCAFLDIAPLTEGHTLVVPKKETDYIFELDDSLYVGLILFAKEIAQAIKKTIPCKRVGIAVLGMEVAHTHIHLIPLNKEGDLNFANPKLQLSKDTMQEIAYKISQAFNHKE